MEHFCGRCSHTASVGLASANVAMAMLDIGAKPRISHSLKLSQLPYSLTS